MALTGETPFEDLLLQNLKGINDKIESIDNNLKNTCDRVTKLEVKWDSAVDQKINDANRKFKLSTIFLSIAMVVTTAWQAIHSR